MEVKPHEIVTVLSQADPAQAAQSLGLVGKHAPWVFKVIGAWRWPLISKHRDIIKPLVTKGYTIDLGGVAAPVGYGSVIVDYQMPAPHGPRSLLDVPPDADCVFCSHTLEHFVDVELAVHSVSMKLAEHGHFIVQVPGWMKRNLNARNWPYHENDFCWAWETNAPDHVVRLDTLLQNAGFEIVVQDQDDTDNRLIIGKLIL